MNKSIGTSWRDFEREHCTPEEIAESNKVVNMLSKSFDKMNKGYITHDEAIIEVFTENPDYADELLNDVIYGGDIDDIKQVQKWYDEAKKRRSASALNMDFWGKLAENVKIAVQNRQNLPLILSRLNDAVSTVKAAMA